MSYTVMCNDIRLSLFKKQNPWLEVNKKNTSNINLKPIVNEIANSP